jgi:hypothetical protein
MQNSFLHAARFKFFIPEAILRNAHFKKKHVTLYDDTTPLPHTPIRIYIYVCVCVCVCVCDA